MNKLLSSLCVATLLSIVGTSNAGTDKTAPASAANEAPKRPGVQLGIRGAVAVPQDIESFLGTTFTSDVMLDLRLADRVVLTPYFGFAKGSVGSTMSQACDRAKVSCDEGGYQVGGIFRISYGRSAKVDAWIGVGFSREWRYAGSDSARATFSGFDGHVVTGFDFFTHGASKLGFYGELAGGDYEEASMTGAPGLKLPTGHQWLSFGFQVVL